MLGGETVLSMVEQPQSLRATMLVTILITLVCAILVTSSVTLLKPRQLAWLAIEQNRAIIAAAGLSNESASLSAGEVVERMSLLSASLLELNRLEVTIGPQALVFDFFAGTDAGGEVYVIPPGQDVAGLGKRPTHAPVYALYYEGKLQRLILPFYGPGMWSRISGYIALEGDLNTVASVVFYQHGETPGIGDQIEQPEWRNHWVGKKVRDAAGRLRLGQGAMVGDSDYRMYQLDAISGATVTSESVITIVSYWLGEDGYGPYLAQLQETPL